MVNREYRESFMTNEAHAEATLTEGQAADLQRVRDRSEPSSRGTAKGGLIKESFAVFGAIAPGFSFDEVRTGILDGRLLQKTSIETRRSIWMALRHRYFSLDPYVARSLARATALGLDSVEFRSLAYLYYAIRDRVVFEFVTGPIWEKWRSGSTSLDPIDFFEFLDALAVEHPDLKRWRESTRIRLGQNVFSALRDFGILTGTQRKNIQQPGVAPETLFHLLSILWAEGLRGTSLLAAPDWRLFLLSESQVAEHLAGFARREWIRFERSGRITILEMRRTLEIR